MQVSRTTQAYALAVSYVLGMETHGALQTEELETLERQGRAMILQLQRSAQGLRTNGTVLDRLLENTQAERGVDVVGLDPRVTTIVQPDASVDIDLTSNDMVADLRLKNAVDDRDRLMILRESRISSATSTNSRWGLIS